MTQTAHRNRHAPRGRALGHLRIRSTRSRPSSLERWGVRYDHHLNQVGGLSEATRRIYWLFIGQFLQWRFGRRPLRMQALRVEDAIDFIRSRGVALACNSLHVLATALRSFLRFLHFTGHARERLANAVVCPAPWPRAAIPEVFSEAELRRFLKGFDRTQAIGKRDFAMALCLCRLGMRAGEVAALKLEDVDWIAQTLRLQQTKTRRDRLLPLPPDVAAALRDYLKTGRPPTDSWVLFVRHEKPYVAGRRSELVCAAMRSACARAGLSARGVHILRHTLATRLCRRGVPLKTIADLLGHRSLNTTARYARVQFQQLRQAALAWPR